LPSLVSDIIPANRPIHIQNTVSLSSPQNETEWEQYYHLRWLVLRKDWGQPVGSERDKYEADAFHIMAQCEKNLVVGVGRIHYASKNSAQIRYMAIQKDQQKKGIGTLILKALEQHAVSQNFSKISLNARNDFTDFYSRMGYQAVSPGETLFGIIHHTKMQKHI